MPHRLTHSQTLKDKATLLLRSMKGDLVTQFTFHRDLRNAVKEEQGESGTTIAQRLQVLFHSGHKCTADFGIHLPFCKGGSGQDQVSCGARHPEVDGDPPGQGGRCQHSQQDGQSQPRPHVWTGAESFQCDLSWKVDFFSHRLCFGQTPRSPWAWNIFKVV